MTLHIYGQTAWHDDAFIVGTPAALRALAAMITAMADYDGVVAEGVYFVNDGEGFSLRVACVNEFTAQRLAVPYTGEFAIETRTHALWPRQL